MEPTSKNDRGLTANLYEGVGWIRTQNGVFNLDEPEFLFDDIAHALSQIPRYNGHTLFPISVAEHSVNVARICRMLYSDNALCREGLMHDATEAYLSDVPAPFKQFLPDWSAIDNKLEYQLRQHFDLGTKTKECKKADWIALFIEAYFLVPGAGEDFSDPLNLRPQALEMMWEEGGILQPQNAGWESDKRLFYTVGKLYGLA